jgi:hypothetical protein
VSARLQVGAARALDKYDDQDVTFGSSREGKFLRVEIRRWRF